MGAGRDWERCLDLRTLPEDPKQVGGCCSRARRPFADVGCEQGKRCRADDPSDRRIGHRSPRRRIGRVERSSCLIPDEARQSNRSSWGCAGLKWASTIGSAGGCWRLTHGNAPGARTTAESAMARNGNGSRPLRSGRQERAVDRLLAPERGMSNEIATNALVAKRAEILFEIGEAEKRIERLQAELAHLNAVLRMFRPNFKAEGLPVRHRRPTKVDATHLRRALRAGRNR
jgi:hypothetical protein